jgi:Flp pilus assembly protein TadD
MLKKDLISEVMREMGRKGGKIGGKRSLVTMTPEERSARAKIASTVAAKKRTEKRLAAQGKKAKKSPGRGKSK